MKYDMYLLIALSVAVVFVDHVWGPRLCLGLQYSEPQLLGLDDSPGPPFLLVPLVETLKLLPPAVAEAGALAGTHQGPVHVLLDALHEQVGHPQSVKQIPGSLWERERERITRGSYEEETAMATFSSAPWFFLRSRKSKTSACQGSR